MSGKELHGALCGDLTRNAVLAFLNKICTLVQQTNRGAYYSTKISSSILSKAALAGVFPLLCLHCYPLKMADFYYACVVPRLVNKLCSYLYSTYAPTVEWIAS